MTIVVIRCLKLFDGNLLCVISHSTRRRTRHRGYTSAQMAPHVKRMELQETEAQQFLLNNFKYLLMTILVETKCDEIFFMK